MQTINGMSVYNYKRQAALALLEAKQIPVIYQTSAQCSHGFVFMEPIDKKFTPKVHFRVTEDSRGWIFQSKAGKSLVWTDGLRGSWEQTTPLFEAIDRRNSIAVNQQARIRKGC